MEEIKSKIKEAIGKINKYIHNLNEDDNFIEQCNIDSLGLIVIASTLEKEFNIFIVDEDFSLTDIDTINKFAWVINEKLK